MRDDENLTVERATFVTHLECSATGARYAADELHNLSRERKPLLVSYDLAGVKKALSKEALARLRRLRGLRRRRGHYQYDGPGGGIALAASPGGETPGDRSKLRGQFFALAFRRVQDARTAGGAVSRMTAGQLLLTTPASETAHA